MARRLTFDFIKTETASGAALGLAAVAALIIANSPLGDAYFTWLKSQHALGMGALVVRLSASDWIKEGLMALFFLTVGLEIKYEILKGSLSDPRTLVTPVVAALGGMLVPALVYALVAAGLGAPSQGWPIPLATDIAFALAVLAVVGRGLPASLRVFLLTLAIVDDLGAIALIAILYSGGVDWVPVAWAGAILALGAAVSRWSLSKPVWVLGFLVVWWLSLRAGLSTSLAAVAFAAIVPVQRSGAIGQGPLPAALHTLHPYVAWGVLPLFAFAKAGIVVVGLSSEQAFAPLVLAIATGLFVGKQIGVFGATWLACAIRWGTLPTGARWSQIYGVSLLCGVGFTMSLFIGALAFPGQADSIQQVEVRMGVMLGSLLSAIAGALVLAVSRK